MENEKLMETRLTTIEAKIDRLNVLEGKIDKLTEICSKSLAQEVKLNSLEKDVEEFKVDTKTRLKELEAKMHTLDSREGDNAKKWLGYILGGVITILLGYIAVQLGIK